MKRLTLRQNASFGVILPKAVQTRSYSDQEGDMVKLLRQRCGIQGDAFIDSQVMWPAA